MSGELSCAGRVDDALAFATSSAVPCAMTRNLAALSAVLYSCLVL
jgi:hypothetical protein